jgi:protein ImuB
MVKRRLLSLQFPDGVSLSGAAPPGDLNALALWCQKFSPLTCVDGPDGVCIDITGCAHLFGGEAGLRRKILERFAGARLAIADTALAAWGLARFGEDGSEDLRGLPLAALRLDDRTVTKLRRVGIRRVGELMRLPRAELTAGYGAGPVLQLARALGTAPEVLRFCTPPAEWLKILHFAEPIFAPAQLQTALASLAADLCGILAAARLGATSLRALFYRVDSARPEIILNFASPCRDDTQISKLLHEKLAEIDPGFGVDAVSLEAATTEALAPAQMTIERAAPDFAAPANVLLNRLGRQRLWRVEEKPTYVPEYVPRRRPINLPPVPWGAQKYPRPLKLLAKPDPITAVAPVPDEPPIFFTWRGKTHKVRKATGPERIAREWWRYGHDNTRPETERIRDYYQVEDFEGGKFWVFRAGMHDGVAVVHWYIHGFFG